MKRSLGIKLIAGYWFLLACMWLFCLVKEISIVVFYAPLYSPIGELNKDTPYLPLVMYVVATPTHFILAYGLLKLRRWAYHLAVIVSVIKCLMTGFSFGSDLLRLIFQGTFSALEKFAMWSTGAEFIITCLILLYLRRKSTRALFLSLPQRTGTQSLVAM